jgi:hypothetical protein
MTGITMTVVERLQPVCFGDVRDYDQPPPDFRHSEPWTTYADGPGGHPLGDPPASVPVRGVRT